MEGDYRNGLPMEAERQNREFFDNYILIPPTRPLQTDPLGGVHNVDEWFDEAIGSALNWYTSHIRFDIFIVNYVYLSKAFEYLKQHPLKVLDTIDKFADRHKLLAEAGIAPEYFYTNEKQEALGLERAGLIWAIKDEERDYFSSITKVPVETFPSPLHKIVKKKTKQENGSDLLRVGYLGARNSVNKNSLIPFLNELLEVDRYHAAPFEVKIFGNIIQELKHFEGHPKIKLLGFVDQVDEFYEQIDISINPVEHSSGQKIKSVEAVEYEMPQLLTKNAAEGVYDRDDFGVSENQGHLIDEILNVSFARDTLDRLAQVSKTTKQKINRKALDQLYELERRCFQRNSNNILIEEQHCLAQLSEYVVSMPAVITRIFCRNKKTLEELLKTLTAAKYPELIFLNNQRFSIIADGATLYRAPNLLDQVEDAFVFEDELGFWTKSIPGLKLQIIRGPLDQNTQRNKISQNLPSRTIVLVADQVDELGMDFIANSYKFRDQITIAAFTNPAEMFQYLDRFSQTIDASKQSLLVFDALRKVSNSGIKKYEGQLASIVLKPSSSRKPVQQTLELFELISHA